MRAGTLRRRITIQQRSTTKDSYGQQAVTWTDYISCWADIQPASGRELVAAQAQQYEISHTVLIRYRTGIVPTMRVVYQGTVYNILAIIDPDMRHESLMLSCSEGLTNG